MNNPLKCATYLRLSSEEQNNGVALERMQFDADLAAKSLGGVIDPSHIFVDLISGRKNDRPDFQGLWSLIEAKVIDVVIFYRVDRLGRDAEVLLRLGNLFRSSGVRAFVCERNKLLDWSDIEDWDYWTRSSVGAERESRIISSRLTKAHQFSRHKKQAAFVCPFGYRRSADRKYEFHPNEVDKAKAMLDILEQEQCKGAASLRRIRSEVGETWTREGLFHWLHNPVLRGHTPYGRGKTSKLDVPTEYHTHSGFNSAGEYNRDSDYRLLTEERYALLKKYADERKHYRGSNAGKNPYPLTGIIFCVCGAPCTIMKSSKQTKKGGHHHYYVRCRAGEGKFRDYPRHAVGVMKMYDIEAVVIQKLIGQAQNLQHFLESGLAIEQKKDPAIIKLEQKIEHIRDGIRKYGDDDGSDQRKILAIQNEIAKLSSIGVNDMFTLETQKSLAQLGSLEKWTRFNSEDLRTSFLIFLDKVITDFDTKSVEVIFNPRIISMLLS